MKQDMWLVLNMQRDSCYGPTLNTTKLQAAFYQDVIQELNDIEQVCDDMRRACTIGV